MSELSTSIEPSALPLLRAPQVTHLRAMVTGRLVAFLLGGLLILPLLYAAHVYDPVVSHSLVEMFSATVAVGIFMLAWNARPFLDNHYVLFVGIAYLFVGTIDYLHAHSFHDLFGKADPNVY